MTSHNTLLTVLGAVTGLLLSVLGAWATMAQGEINTHTLRLGAVEARLATAEARYEAILHRLNRIDTQLDRIETKVSEQPASRPGVVTGRP